MRLHRLAIALIFLSGIWVAGCASGTESDSDVPWIGGEPLPGAGELASTGSAAQEPEQPEQPPVTSPAQPEAPAGSKPPTKPSRYAMAKHWAPVIYHDTDDRHYVADFIISYDFDGDKRSDNNWENLADPHADLGAVVYYSAVETSTHWYLLYTFFHPRDWANNCSPLIGEPCHENDLEGAMVVVRKSLTGYGTFEVLYTEAHSTLHIYANDPAIRAASGHLEVGVTVTFENGSHPEIYVESKGHGVCALYHSGSGHCKHPTNGYPPPFPGDDGIVYRHKGKAEVPTSGNDRDVGYSLRSMRYAFWAQRKNICNSGCTFDKSFTYEGMTLGVAFDGDSFKADAANPPWAWDDPSDGAVLRGDFFFRPAETMRTHLIMPKPVSTTYRYNPYLLGN